MSTHTKLSVNINKIATIRNARGGDNPSVTEAAIRIQEFGAEGITVHPRPDERHIRKSDVLALKKVVSTEFNIEGYPSPDFIQMVCDIKPEQVTLVPDPPDVLTSNNGWDCVKFGDFLKEVVSEFKQHGIRVSIFLNPDPAQAEAAANTGADRVELYTESFASQYPTDKEAAVKPYVETALACHKLGLGINAGHDLSLENLRYLKQQIPFLAEVSIGHALISDALYLGLENVVAMYKRQLSDEEF
jgi:pyridoxine 5-phosphate synthase